MSKNLRIIFYLTLSYSFLLLIVYLKIFLISDIPQNILLSFVPTANENKMCYFLPLVIIIIFHLIIFQKNLNASKTEKCYKNLVVGILYLNIAITTIWVINVEKQFVDAHKIASAINKYYEFNNKYPQNIDSILTANYIDNSKKIFDYYKSEIYSDFTLSFQPNEIQWYFFSYQKKQNKFVITD